MHIEDRLARIEAKLGITPPQVTIDDVYRHQLAESRITQIILRKLQSMTAEDQALVDAFTLYSTQEAERTTLIQETLTKLAASPAVQADPVVADIASKLSAAVTAAQPALDALKAAVETSTTAPAAGSGEVVTG